MTTTLDRLTARLEYIGEGLDGIGEMLGDTLAEARGEIARFGDAWPGAMLDIRRMEDAITRLERDRRKVVAALDEQCPLYGPPAPECRAESNKDGLWGCTCSECVALQIAAEEPF